MSPARSDVDTWFAVHPARERLRLRVFAFPHGGAGPGIFRAWSARLPGHVELCGIRLPGREIRHREPAFLSMGPLVDTTVDVIRSRLDVPYVLFGHSVGALIAFEIGRKLRRLGLPMPEKMIVTGHSAPQVRLRHRPIHRLPDRELIDEMKEFAGTPRQILEDPDVMALMLPVIRADFSVRETYRFVEEAPLACPLSAYAGTDDSEVLENELSQWRCHTDGAFTSRMFAGNHFFVFDPSSGFVEALRGELTAVST